MSVESGNVKEERRRGSNVFSDEGGNQRASYSNPILFLSQLILRIKNTKSKYDRIINKFSLSFHVGASNNGLGQDMIF